MDKIKIDQADDFDTHFVIGPAQMATAKPQLPGRLNEIKSDPADQEVWSSEFAGKSCNIHAIPCSNCFFVGFVGW